MLCKRLAGDAVVKYCTDVSSVYWALQLNRYHNYSKT